MVTVPAQYAENRFHPILTVTVNIEGYEEVAHPAVVDSGAVQTIFPAELLEANGVQYESLAEVGGKGISATAEFDFRICQGILSWRGVPFCSYFLVAEAGTELAKQGRGLLGRDDFFRTFAVDFSGWRNDPPVFDLEMVAQPAASGSQRS